MPTECGPEWPRVERCVCQASLQLGPLDSELASGLFFGCALYSNWLCELLEKNENLFRFDDVLHLPMLGLLNICCCTMYYPRMYCPEPKLVPAEG